MRPAIRPLPTRMEKGRGGRYLAHTRLQPPSPLTWYRTAATLDRANGEGMGGKAPITGTPTAAPPLHPDLERPFQMGPIKKGDGEGRQQAHQRHSYPLPFT